MREPSLQALKLKLLVSVANVQCSLVFTVQTNLLLVHHAFYIIIESDDLYEVNSEVVSVAARWKNLGLALRLDPDRLDVIEGENRRMEDCLTEVLSLWLKKMYDYERVGDPSWQLLARAVGDPVGGNNPALAEKIAKKM